MRRGSARAIVGVVLSVVALAGCAGGGEPAAVTPTTVARLPATAAATASATPALQPAPTATTAAPATAAPRATAGTDAALATPSPVAAPSPTAPPVELAPVDAELAGLLLAGGYVIYIRAIGSGSDGGDIDACVAQRPLDDDALARARLIGVAFQQLELPVGVTLRGPSCAEAVAAKVAFGTAEPLEPAGAVPAGAVHSDANVIVVADLPEINNTPGLDTLENGDALVLAMEAGTLTPVAVVRADEWLALATMVNGPAWQQYPVPAGSRPHDVAPAADGGVWYTAQGSGELGWLDPVTGETLHIPLGPGSAPHGVIVGPDGAPWVTDSGQNAIVRVDPHTHETQVFGLPPGTPSVNLNTAAFDGNGIHWFTGQAGYYGRLDPATGETQVWDAPRGRGPYGIDATPEGEIYYASLAGSHIARIDIITGEVTVIDPPTAGQGARRVWCDSQGRVWVSEWNVGQVSVYDPASGEWREWRLPGNNPMPYSVYVDERDIVWLSDFDANTLVRFDPETETFVSFSLPSTPSNVRQILGRQHEVWGAESAADTLVVLRVP
ncbi:MAG TPA: hypothetical protein VMM78_18175 [Thermomicrobiales bacterium]|nr:hypothetical protein [Thermomicrobiales bacterium]